MFSPASKGFGTTLESKSTGGSPLMLLASIVTFMESVPMFSNNVSMVSLSIHAFSTPSTPHDSSCSAPYASFRSSSTSPEVSIRFHWRGRGPPVAFDQIVQLILGGRFVPAIGLSTANNDSPGPMSVVVTFMGLPSPSVHVSNTGPSVR